MKKKTKIYVSHPRYGNAPMHQQRRYTDDDIKNSYWYYKFVTFFRNSAISADISKQNYTTCPRRLYVDIEKSCLECGRAFIFYALEQRYWYEELKFYIDADCRTCIDCRNKEKKVKEKTIRYEELILMKNRTIREIKELKNIASELSEIGYLKNKSKLAQILNMREK